MASPITLEDVKKIDFKAEIVVMENSTIKTKGIEVTQEEFDKLPNKDVIVAYMTGLKLAGDSASCYHTGLKFSINPSATKEYKDAEKLYQNKKASPPWIVSTKICCGKPRLVCPNCGFEECQSLIVDGVCPHCHGATIKTTTNQSTTPKKPYVFDRKKYAVKTRIKEILELPPPKMKKPEHFCLVCCNPANPYVLFSYPQTLVIYLCKKHLRYKALCPTCHKQFYMEKNYGGCCSPACQPKSEYKDFILPGQEAKIRALGIEPWISLTEEAADFYILQDIAINYEEVKIELKKKTNFLATNFSNYFLIAALGEARHWNEVSKGNTTKPLAKFLNGGRAISREQVWYDLPKALEFAGDELTLLALIYDIFESGWEPSFGGGNWAKIVYQVIRYKQGVDSPAIFVDTSFGLYHNGALAFDKLWKNKIEPLEVVLQYNLEGNMKEVFNRASAKVKQLARIYHYCPKDSSKKEENHE